MPDDVIVQRLEFDAAQALQALQEVNTAAESTAGKANLLNKKLQDYSRALGQSWQTTLAQMRELVGMEGTQFGGFTTPLGKDVTADVFKQTEALAKRSQAIDKYVTEDTQASRSEMTFDGSIRQANVAVGEQSAQLQRLTAELNALKIPTQGRNELGQFLPVQSFETQFKSLATFQEQLKLVETTISQLHTKTNLPFKDIGGELGRTFPQLLKDTELVDIAVKNLTRDNAGLSASFKTEAEVVDLVRRKLTEMQAQGRLALTNTGTNQGVVTQLKGIIKEVSLATGAQYSEVANQLEKMGFSSAQANAAVKGLNTELTKGTREAQGFRHGIDIVRTALGTLTAVGIFQFLSLITKSFQDAVKASRELEDSMFRLSNVERILSQAGTEISLSGLKKGIQEIKDLFPIFSQEDVTQLVAQVAISTKELGLSQKQIIDLSKAIAILNIRSTEEETASATAQKVISSLITDNARGIASLGLSFNENTMQIKGMEMGIVTATHKLADLSNEEKAQIKFAVLLQNTSGELSNVGDYLDTNTAKLKENAASWHDLLTSIGSIFTSLTPLFSPLLQFIQDGVNGFKAMLVVVFALREAVTEFRKIYTSAITDLSLNPVERLKKVVEGFKNIPNELKTNMGNWFEGMFPAGAPANAPEWFKKLFGDFTQDVDTATGAVDNFQNGINSIDTSKASDAIEDLIKSLIDLQKKMAEAEAEFQLKLSRFDEDTAREREQIVEDYNLNVEQTTRQFALRRQEAEEKYRQRELEAERRFQENLRQLREKFLYNLEDALRERDARQVLRLIDSYNMEKDQMIREEQLRKQAAAEQHALEMAELKREEEERLRVMAEEFQLKIQRYDEESAIKRQRMIEDHAIEMQKLEEQKEEILQKAAEKIAEEYGLNAEGAKALYDLLAKYYGSDGALAQLTAQGYSAMLGQSTAFLAQIAAVIAQYQSMLSAVASNPFLPTGITPAGTTPTPIGNSPQGTQGYASGGQFVATKPRNILVGEGGEPELVTVTPLSKLASMRSHSQAVNGADGLDGRNGDFRIALDMNLSPDLEARVVQKSLDGAATVVERINRGKR